MYLGLAYDFWIIRAVLNMKSKPSDDSFSRDEIAIMVAILALNKDVSYRVNDFKGDEKQQKACK